MPLVINVGLNRKSSRNYQSQGTSINITAELDPALLASPQRLQDEIAALYRQAETALDQQSSRIAATQPSPSPDPRLNGPPHAHTTPQRPESPLRSVTRNQLHALHDLAEGLGTDLESIAREVFAKPPRDLNIREASKLIDQLKVRVHRARQTQHAGANGTLPSSGDQANPA